MAVYPNRGIIDGAFAVVHDGVQRSVFASGRIPEDRAQMRIGPLTIDVVEPLRVTRVRVDAADLGIDADVTFTARTVALEEPRQTITAGTKRVMDSTRLTQWGTWSGRIVGRRRRDPDRPRVRHQGPVVGRATGRRAHAGRARATRCRRSSSSGRRSTGTTAARTSSASSAATVIASSGARRCCNSSATATRRGASKRRARNIEHLAGTVAERALGARACGVRRARRCDLLRHSGADERHRARAAAHVPHARPRLHASRVGPRRAGTASRRSAPRSTRSRSSTTSSRGTSTSSR